MQARGFRIKYVLVSVFFFIPSSCLTRTKANHGLVAKERLQVHATGSARCVLSRGLISPICGSSWDHERDGRKFCLVLASGFLPLLVVDAFLLILTYCESSKFSGALGA